MSDWFETTQGLWTKGWEMLGAGGPHRFVTLATLGRDGPETRLVVLRRAEAALARVEIYTDATSRKCAELTRDPRVSLHHWTAKLALQLRLRGTAEVTTGERLRAAWDALPEPQRGSYGVQPPPGTEIPASGAYTRAPRFDQFARVTLTVTDVDIVHLSDDHHRRARFQRSTGWQGRWLAP